MEEQTFATATLFFFIIGGAVATTLTITNNCKETLWISTNSVPNKPRLPPTDADFVLASKALKSIHPPAAWSGHIWARTGCASDHNGWLICATGGCGPDRVDCSGGLPTSSVTMVDFVLAGGGGVGGGGGDRDGYKVSLLPGFNVPVAVLPQGGSPGCRPAACPIDINWVCPPELRVVTTSWRTVACMSACQALKDPENCCFEKGKGPVKCKPTKYTNYFKSLCPLAFVYPNDDTGEITCAAGSDYAVIFCPVGI